jgi:DNA topoisomerase-6 subunit B
MQSKLAGTPGIADELAQAQREISIAEFFEKNKHMLGFDSNARGLVTAVKEAVDNALDATEEAGIRPSIYVEIRESGNYYQLIIEDNGPGITEAQIPKIFGKLLYGSRFHSRRQSRGQQGIGISAAVLHSQLTSGEPAKITSQTQGSETANYYELRIDTDKNEPEIEAKEEVECDKEHGTRIELEMAANMRARQQLHDYIRYTALVNPHAAVELVEPNKHMKFDRVTDEMPSETREIRPHPNGVELGMLIKMLGRTKSHSLSGFLQEEFTRVGKTSAEKVLDNFRDRHFGREFGFLIPEGEQVEAFRESIDSAVRNKGEEATTGFIDEIMSRLEEMERVTYSEIRAVVSQSAEDAVDEFGKTFGSTVRENATEAAWVVLTADPMPSLAPLVQKSNSRKSDEAINTLTESLTGSFSALSDTSRLTVFQLEEMVEDAADTAESTADERVGETARENLFDAIWGATSTVTDKVPLVREVASDRDMAANLVTAMRSTSIMAPPTDCLAPITPDLMKAGLETVYDCEFYATSIRSAGVHSGEPFVVEAGLAYGGELKSEGNIELIRFANRVPLVYHSGACALTGQVKGMDWRNYFKSGSGLSQSGGSGRMPDGPMVLMVHVASTNVPFTSESKDALADVEVIEKQIELAVRECGRELQSFLQQKRERAKRQRKQNVLVEILPEVAEKAAEVAESDVPEISGSLAQIMNNVLVTRTDDDGSVALLVENYTRSNASLTVTETYGDEPDNVPSDATVEETEDGWTATYTWEVSSGDTDTLEYAPATTLDGLSITGVDETILTVTEEEVEA